jgi:hypothetical protein
MAIIKNKTTNENRLFWSHVEEVAREVQTWPRWMGNRSDREEVQTADQKSLKCDVTEKPENR